jgi:hypothetical protein
MWLITHWYNYKCNFCGVDVYNRKFNKGIRQRSAFDYYSPREGLATFDRQFPTKELNLTMTGGEPFMDRRPLPPTTRWTQPPSQHHHQDPHECFMESGLFRQRR